MTDELRQSVQAPPPNDAASMLIDCPYEGLLQTKLKPGLLIAATIVAVLFMIIVVFPNEPFAAFLIIAVLGLLGYFGFLIGTDKHRDTVLNPKLGVPNADAIREALTPQWFYAGAQSGSIIKQLSTLGCRNITSRIGKARDLKPVVPIEESFEPIPLDETGGLFCQLEHDAGQNTIDPPTETSSLMRNIRLGGGWLMLLPFLFLVGMGVLESIQKKRITGSLIQWSIFMLIILLGIGKGAWRSHLQWFLVPGGIAVRRSRRWKNDWRIELYRRAECVLVVRNTQGGIWAAYVADPEKHANVTITQREVEMLLRAWLSPLPTPPLDRLSDLT